ncbi:hypothetical protein RB623_06190 [Mesorhizobium sp. LHD-90]|uniref:hypothetical protein n=1 Tax=Mesorhizobium sp. LHD-90 TaxID=3071414 RepID=UPI0027DF2A40|nr:hypothetical protein [Mesorhizobium sp. LHD-90]MDQ6433638.1 hypothetical protein [Mesorhizobium sp. LHD-90]
MITLFDPNTTATEYLKLAAIDPQLPDRLNWFLRPGFDFGFNAGNLKVLKEQATEICVHADWNGISNIKVSWTTLGDDGPKLPDDRRELLWYRRFKQALDEAQLGFRGGLFVAYAHIARYNQLLNDIRSAGVTIIRASRIMPFWEFNVDIQQAPA